jgi:DNA-binding CsgD family transcriptional regulator
MSVLTRRLADGELDALNDDIRLHELIGCLVDHVTPARDPTFRIATECTHEEIIVDTNMDGVRYLIIRMPLSPPLLTSLSPREQEIARMVARGYPNKTIAGVLNISSWTVCTHIRRIFAKLGVASRAAMVARLLKEGQLWEQQVDPRLRASSAVPPSVSSAPPVAANGSEPTVAERILARRGPKSAAPLWKAEPFPD